jgi:hypothetical protein
VCGVECKCGQVVPNDKIEKLQALEAELAEVADKTVKAASDPFSGVIRFIAERPENSSMPGPVLNGVLDRIFTDSNCPGLLRLMSGHVKEVIRRGKSVEMIKEHATSEPFSDFVVKQAQKVKFDVGDEKGKMVLNNILGITGVEHGIELPLEKILVSPPNLIVTVKLGLMRPQKTVAI